MKYLTKSQCLFLADYIEEKKTNPSKRSHGNPFRQTAPQERVTEVLLEGNTDRLSDYELGCLLKYAHPCFPEDWRSEFTYSWAEKSFFKIPTREVKRSFRNLLKEYCDREKKKLTVNWCTETDDEGYRVYTKAPMEVELDRKVIDMFHELSHYRIRNMMNACTDRRKLEGKMPCAEYERYHGEPPPWFPCVTMVPVTWRYVCSLWMQIQKIDDLPYELKDTCTRSLYNNFILNDVYGFEKHRYVKIRRTPVKEELFPHFPSDSEKLAEGMAAIAAGRTGDNSLVSKIISAAMWRSVGSQTKFSRSGRSILFTNRDIQTSDGLVSSDNGTALQQLEKAGIDVNLVTEQDFKGFLKWDWKVRKEAAREGRKFTVTRLVKHPDHEMYGNFIKFSVHDRKKQIFIPAKEHPVRKTESWGWQLPEPVADASRIDMMIRGLRNEYPSFADAKVIMK